MYMRAACVRPSARDVHVHVYIDIQITQPAVGQQGSRGWRAGSFMYVLIPTPPKSQHRHRVLQSQSHLLTYNPRLLSALLHHHLLHLHLLYLFPSPPPSCPCLSHSPSPSPSLSSIFLLLLLVPVVLAL